MTEITTVLDACAPRSSALQGFPQHFTFIGSPTDVTKMLGQAVQIDTARAILHAIVAEAFDLSGGQIKALLADGLELITDN